VTATTRGAERLASLRAAGVDGVVMDGLDAVSVRRAVASVQPEAIIHEMTALSAGADLRHFDRSFAATNRLRTEGIDHLLAAARVAGVRRFVAQSYTGWTNVPGSGPLATEVDPFDPHPVAGQRETLAALRYLEKAVLAAPLEGIVLRYGNFYGPGGSEQLVEAVRKRRLPLVDGAAGVWSWIHLDDAATATVDALERGEPGIYNIVDDDPAPVSEWLPYLASLVGARPPVRIPVWLARLVAGQTVVRAMTLGHGASNAKARRELGWSPRWASWREGFREALLAPRAAGPARVRGLRPQEAG
jgi:nucleoside-diphosphate-sugar epimerase